MCGIIGYLGNLNFEKKRLEDASRNILHRGPDDIGIYQNKNVNNNIILIHLRLSIIDLEPRSGQPFRIGKNILIFNGEIYNYIEVKNDLLS